MSPRTDIRVVEPSGSVLLANSGPQVRSDPLYHSVSETLLLLLLLLIKIFMYKNVVYFYIYNIHVLPYFLRGLKRIANTYVFTENLVSGFSRDNSRVR